MYTERQGTCPTNRNLLSLLPLNRPQGRDRCVWKSRESLRQCPTLTNGWSRRERTHLWTSEETRTRGRSRTESGGREWDAACAWRASPWNRWLSKEAVGTHACVRVVRTRSCAARGANNGAKSCIVARWRIVSRKAVTFEFGQLRAFVLPPPPFPLHDSAPFDGVRLPSTPRAQRCSGFGDRRGELESGPDHLRSLSLSLSLFLVLSFSASLKANTRGNLICRI